MSAEYLLFIGFFALVSVGLLLVSRHAMSVSSLYDIENRNDDAGTGCIGGCMSMRLIMALVLPCTIAICASATGLFLHTLLARIGVDAPVEILPTGVWTRYADIGEVIRPSPAIAASCAIILCAAAVLLRDSAAFVFLAFHAALAFLCFVVDQLFTAPILDRASVTAWVTNSAFYLILVSQFFFAFLMAGTFRKLLVGLLSAVISGATFAVGATVLAVLATVVDETSFMLMVYLVIAYGIVAPHVTALSILLSDR